MSDASDVPPPTSPWEPGVRAIDVPIMPGGFPSPFAASKERAGDLKDNARRAEPQFSFDNLPDIPAIAELKKRPRWVTWKYATRKKANGETYQTKPPVNPHNNRGAKVDDPDTWGSYEEAVACALRYDHAGVGYVLTGDDDISGHDLDKVRDPVTGKLVDWAQAIVDLGETYTEILPSGAGVRMFWHGKLSAAIKLDAAQVEVYSTGRYLTVTGHRIAGTSDAIAPAPKTLQLLRARVETFKEAEARARSEETIIPASGPGVRSARHRWSKASRRSEEKPAATAAIRFGATSTTWLSAGLELGCLTCSAELPFTSPGPEHGGSSRQRSGAISKKTFRSRRAAPGLGHPRKADRDRPGEVRTAAPPRRPRSGCASGAA